MNDVIDLPDLRSSDLSHNLNIRCTLDQRELWYIAARKLDKSPSEWIRGILNRAANIR